MRWILIATVLFMLTSCVPTYNDSREDLHDDRNVRGYWERDYERGAFERSMMEEDAGFRD